MAWDFNSFANYWGGAFHDSNAAPQLVNTTGGSNNSPSNPVIYGQVLQSTAVSANTYGEIIPVSFGARRIVGQIIWAKPLSQTSVSTTTYSQGGVTWTVFGTPYAGDNAHENYLKPKLVTNASTTYYTYATFAVSFGRPGNPNARQFLTRVWANAILIYDSRYGWIAGSGTLRFYDGDENQGVDSAIYADKGIYAPAYRGQMVAVFEGFQIDNYGQKIPTITAEIVESITPGFGVPVGFAGIGAGLLEGSSNEYGGAGGAFTAMTDFSARLMFTCYAMGSSGSPEPNVLSAWSVDARTLLWRAEVDLTPLSLVNDWLEVVDCFNGFLICVADDGAGAFYWVTLSETDGSVLYKGGGSPWTRTGLPFSLDQGFSHPGRSVAYDTAGNPTVYLWAYFNRELLIYTMDPNTGSISASPAMATGAPASSPSGTAFGGRVAFQSLCLNNGLPDGGFFFCRGASYRGGADIYFASTCDDGVCRAYRMVLQPNSAGWSINQIWSQPSPNKVFALQYDATRDEVMIVYGQAGNHSGWPYTAGSFFADKVSAAGATRWTVSLLANMCFLYATPGYAFAGQSGSVNSADQFFADYMLLDYEDASGNEHWLTIANQDGQITFFDDSSPYVYVNTRPYWVDSTGSIYAAQSAYVDPIAGWIEFDGPSVIPATASANSSGYSLAGIITDISIVCGFNPGDVTTENISDTVIGAIMTDQSDFRSFVTNLGKAFGFDIVQTPTTMKCKRVATGTSLSVDATIANSDILDQQSALNGATVSGSGIVTNSRTIQTTAYAGITLTRASQTDLPYALDIGYLDAARDYQITTQRAQRPLFPVRSADSTQVASYQTPIVLSGSQAAAYAAQALYRQWSQSVSQSFLLSRKWLAIEPNDVVDVALGDIDIKGKVIEATIGGDLSMGLVLVNLWTDETLTLSVDAPSVLPPITQLTIASQAYALDCPLIVASDDLGGSALQNYVVLAPLQAGRSWAGATLYFSTDGTTYTQENAVSGTPLIGFVANALGAPSGAMFATDSTNTLTVTISFGDSSAMASTNSSGIAAGSNLAAVGRPGRWELIQYETVVANADGSFTLSVLHRGLRGTDPHFSDHAVGDLFILLNGNGLTSVGVPTASLGSKVYAKALGLAQQLSDVTNAAAWTETGNAEKPWTAQNLTAAISGSNILLGATRRDRKDPSLAGNTAVASLPMSEAAEKYDIEILNGSGTVVRTITDWAPASPPTTAAWSYTYTTAAADLGAMPTTGSHFTFRVYQKSAVVGRGFMAQATVTL